MDPANPNTATPPADPTTMTAAADTPATPPEPKGDEAALEALDRGIEESSTQPAVAKPAATDTPAGDDKGAAQPNPDELGADPAKPAAQAPAPDQPKPGDKPVVAKSEPDAEVEAEIKQLRLSAKSADRFRTMSAEIKSLAPVKDAMEKAGIKDPVAFVQQQVPVLLQRSKDFEDMVGMVSATGATPQMYTMMLDYMADAVSGAQGDLNAAQRAYDRTLKELSVWGKLLGREVPGLVDPLETHTDLKAAVEAGDITRELALKTAQERNANQLMRGRNERTDTANAQQQAQTAGRAALDTLEQQLKAKDADYLRKRDFFLPAVRRIVAKYPPDQWAAEAERAYAEIPALPKAPAPPPPPANTRPLPGPVRGGARMSVAHVPKDPMEALEMGIEAAGGG